VSESGERGGKEIKAQGERERTSDWYIGRRYRTGPRHVCKKSPGREGEEKGRGGNRGPEERKRRGIRLLRRSCNRAGVSRNLVEEGKPHRKRPGDRGFEERGLEREAQKLARERKAP